MKDINPEICTDLLETKFMLHSLVYELQQAGVLKAQVFDAILSSLDEIYERLAEAIYAED